MEESAASPADRLELVLEPPTAALAEALVRGRRRGDALGAGTGAEGGARLLAVGPGNELVWQAPAAGKPPLAERARRLWAQTGDFSKFRADLLRARTQHPLESPESGPQADSAPPGVENLNAPASGQEESDAADAEEEEEEEEEEGGDAAVPDQSVPELEPLPGLMTIEEMRGLKERMMTQLTAAQHAAYFSHMLVSLLVLGAKEKEKEARAGSGPAARAVLPGSVDPADRSSRAVSAAPSATGSATEGPPPAEWGLEPTALGVSRLQLRDDPLEAVPPEEDADADVAEQDTDRPPDQVGALVSDYEVARAAARKLAFRRQGMRAAVDILRHGAGRLASAVGVVPEPSWVPPDPVQAPADAQAAAGPEGVQEEAHQTAVMRATKHNTLVGHSETLRWEALRRLRQSGSGWPIKPGKPVEDELRRTEGLLLQGLPHYNKHEEARDFWIGYGVPEGTCIFARCASSFDSVGYIHTLARRD